MKRMIYDMDAEAKRNAEIAEAKHQRENARNQREREEIKIPANYEPELMDIPSQEEDIPVEDQGNETGAGLPLSVAYKKFPSETLYYLDTITQIDMLKVMLDGKIPDNVDLRDYSLDNM